MNKSIPKHICPECGLELPASAADFGCPGCSLRLALSSEAAAAPAVQPPLPPGLRSRFFGDYEILEELGRGGMGVVYRARQLSLNRLVALKMVQSHHLLSDEAGLRFRLEIEAVAQLHHPHIVSLYESGERDGAHYFTMRLVEGGDLASQAKLERPLRERVQLLVKVCRAVHYAHQRGILHRDLKPSNILVDPQGEPHVADFGLARSVDHDSGFTFTSSVLGSPNYMAPEQAIGKTRQLTTAVDVYGLGAILYHLLAGRPPFQARTPIETLRLVVDQDPAPPRSANSQADADLETIALKCLRKEPGERYGTAEELAQDLERWLAGRPILARPLGPFAMAWRWSRRHPVTATLGAALALALAAIVIGTAFALLRIERAEQRSAASLGESLLREAASLRLGSELGHRTEAMRLIKEAAALGGSPEFRARVRNELLATLARTEVEFVPVTHTNLPPNPELIGITPRFDMIASVRNATSVVFRTFTSGASRGRLDCREPVSRVDTFSPNGRYVALWHDDVLSVRDLRTARRCLTHVGAKTTFAFHPREDAILLQESPNVAVWLDLPSGAKRFGWEAPLPRAGGRDTGWRALAFSPDGRMVAGASGTSSIIELMDPQTGVPLALLTNNTRHTLIMSWSNNGALLAAASFDGRINLWETATGLCRWTSPAMVASAQSLAFHSSGDWLAVACEDDMVRLIDIPAERFVFEHPGEADHVAFSPGGNRLGPLQWQGQCGYLEFRRPKEFTGFAVAHSSFRLSDVRFSADGKLLATGHSDHVIVCDAERGTPLRSMGEWRTCATLFHPNGRDLLIGESKGLLRYEPRFSAPNRLLFGTGAVIHAEGGWQALDCSPDGRFFAAYNVHSRQALVFDHSLTNRLAAIEAPANTSAVAISPDGRWLVTFSRGEQGVKLWDVAAQKLLRDFPGALLPRGAFSPDGRWLGLSNENEFELLETGSWKPAPPLLFGNEIAGVGAFSPDGRWLALAVNRFTVHLFDLQRFAPLGILRPPVAVHIRALAFSPDGSNLAGVGEGARVAVWQLNELRQRLSEFQLTWD